MNVDLGIWNKLTQAVVVLVAIAILLLIGWSYLPVIQKNERMRRELDRLEAEQKKQEDQYQQLHAQIDALRNDPKTVERLVREKLGYAKPDEMVIRFDPSTTNLPTH